MYVSDVCDSEITWNTEVRERCVGGSENTLAITEAIVAVLDAVQRCLVATAEYSNYLPRDPPTHMASATLG